MVTAAAALLSIAAAPPCRPPAGARLLSDDELRALFVGATMIGPDIVDNSPVTTDFLRDGRFVSHSYGVISARSDGKYAFMNRRVCLGNDRRTICSPIAHTRRGSYLIGGIGRSGWVWEKVAFRRAET